MTATILVRQLVETGEAELTTGPFGTQLKASDYVDAGVPMLNVRNIGFGDVRESDLEFLPNDVAERLNRHRLKRGDIVFGRKGAVERHAFIGEQFERWMQGSDCLRLRLASPRFMPRFVSYCLLTDRHIQWMKNHCASGATMPSLNQDILGRIPLPLTAISSQEKIASVLSAYDDLIDNNNRRIKILEEMARRIYHEWFVDFRYPGRDDSTLVSSELGPLPQGWSVVSFTDLAEVLSGGTPRTADPMNWGGSIPFFTPRDAPDGIIVATTEKHITDIGLAGCNSRLYPSGTVFITARGTVGKVVMNAVPMAMNQSCYAVQGKDLPQEWVLFALRNRVDYLRANTGGATFDTIIVDTFRRMRSILPPQEIAEAFAAAVSPMIRAIIVLGSQTAAAQSARDFLLPRLISGQVDVSNLDIAMPPAAAS